MPVAEEVLEGLNRTTFGGMGEMLEGLEGQLFAMMKSTAAIPETFREHVAAFRAAINWSEPWIQGLVAMHVVMWTTFFVFRKWPRVQGALLVTIAVLVGGAERLNALGAEHWRRFATQNYFDDHGVFAASVFCAPMLALAFTQLVHVLWTASTLLVQVKRKELVEHAKARHHQAAAAKDDQGVLPPKEE